MHQFSFSFSPFHIESLFFLIYQPCLSSYSRTNTILIGLDSSIQHSPPLQDILKWVKYLMPNLRRFHAFPWQGACHLLSFLKNLRDSLLSTLSAKKCLLSFAFWSLVLLQLHVVKEFKIKRMRSCFTTIRLKFWKCWRGC